MPTCEICGKEFDSKEELMEHAEEEHPEEAEEKSEPKETEKETSKSKKYTGEPWTGSRDVSEPKMFLGIILAIIAFLIMAIPLLG